MDTELLAVRENATCLPWTDENLTGIDEEAEFDTELVTSHVKLEIID